MQSVISQNIHEKYKHANTDAKCRQKTNEKSNSKRNVSICHLFSTRYLQSRFVLFWINISSNISFQTQFV